MWSIQNEGERERERENCVWNLISQEEFHSFVILLSRRYLKHSKAWPLTEERKKNTKIENKIVRERERERERERVVIDGWIWKNGAWQYPNPKPEKLSWRNTFSIQKPEFYKTIQDSLMWKAYVNPERKRENSKKYKKNWCFDDEGLRIVCHFWLLSLSSTRLWKREREREKF